MNLINGSTIPEICQECPSETSKNERKEFCFVFCNKSNGLSIIDATSFENQPLLFLHIILIVKIFHAKTIKQVISS